MSKHTGMDGLMRYANYLGFGNVHMKVDSKTGLRAIIAIHSTKRGPAIGGCRMLHYDCTEHAVEDALRLGCMMSYKAAITGLPHGGAKAVIMMPRKIKNREAFFERFGEFVHELDGRYITAVDSGTSPVEMDIIARKTPFVTCTSQSGSTGDPSPITALGVFRGMEAAVKFKLDRELAKTHVVVQGLGHVGYALTRLLHEAGARVTVSDVNETLVQKVVNEFKVESCAVRDVFDIKADVFSPNALGAIINRDTIHRLNVKVIAGAANNQLAHQEYGHLLLERGILYAPDFLINAGGLIYVAVFYAGGTHDDAVQKINQIYNMTYDICEQSASKQLATNFIAKQIAQDRLQGS